MTRTKKYFIFTGILLLLFALLIVAVKCIDVGAIGPMDSQIGLSTLNGAVRDVFGYNELWYDSTELLGLVALAVAGGFALLGLCQLVKRRSLKKVDSDIWVLAGTYICMLALYVLFEICVINYRPILIEGELEASFPSSHTMLVICIMGTAAIQLYGRIKQIWLRCSAMSLCIIIAGYTAFGRLASGVHWLSDIVGGVLIGCVLISSYAAVCALVKNKANFENKSTEA